MTEGRVSPDGVDRFPFPVGPIGYGAMPLSIDGRPERDESLRTLLRAVECGVRLIDTANVYALDDTDLGHNEALVAEGLRAMGLDPGNPESGVVVATKGGMRRPGGRWVADGRPEALREACHGSLRALGVERIALYQLHTPDPAVVPFVESVGALARLREEGKIGWVGLSNVTAEQVREADEVVPVASVQNALSVWDAGWGTPPLVRHCGAHGILFLAHSPFGGRGRAAGLAAHPPLVDAGERLGVTPWQVALAWLRALDGSVVPIPGSRSASRVEQNRGAAAVELGPEPMRRLTKALRHARGLGAVARSAISHLLHSVGR